MECDFKKNELKKNIITFFFLIFVCAFSFSSFIFRIFPEETRDEYHRVTFHPDHPLKLLLGDEHSAYQYSVKNFTFGNPNVSIFLVLKYLKLIGYEHKIMAWKCFRYYHLIAIGRLIPCQLIAQHVQ